MPLGLTPAHLLLVLVIALIVVGPGKLPEVGQALGKTIKEFRKAASDVQEATSLTSAAPPAAPAPAPVQAAPAPVPAPAAVTPVAPAPVAPAPAQAAPVAAPAETAVGDPVAGEIASKSPEAGA